MRGQSLFTVKDEIYGVYERVNGLTRSNPVIFYGYKIGSVKQIRFERTHPPRIVVKMNIDKDVSIPKNSKAVIVNAGFLGSKAVEINPGQSQKNIEAGDTLLTEVEVSLIEEVNQSIAPLRSKVDTTITVLNRILSNAPVNSIERSFRSIQNTLYSLERTTSNVDTLVEVESKVIRRILLNLDNITSRLNTKTLPRLDTALGNFATLSDSLSKTEIKSTVASTQRTIKELQKTLALINEGDGSLSKLIKDDELYYNLNNASRDLDRLLLDMQNRPGRYVKFPLISVGNSEGRPEQAEEYMQKRDQKREEEAEDQ